MLRDTARGGVKCFECYKVWREEGESCFNREAQILLVVLRADFLFFETQGRVGNGGVAAMKRGIEKNKNGFLHFFNFTIPVENVIFVSLKQDYSYEYKRNISWPRKLSKLR